MKTTPSPLDQPIQAQSPSPLTVWPFALVVLGLATLAWSTLSTASARFAGSTSNEQSYFEAVELEVSLGPRGVPTSSLSFSIDAMYPGQTVERCLTLGYEGGNAPVPIRLHGRSDTPNELDPYLDLRIERGVGSLENCGDFVNDEQLYVGPLPGFWQRHGTYASGVDALPLAVDGDHTVLRIVLSMASETPNEAQGLAARFWLIAEVQP